MLLTDFDKKKYERCQREEGREEARVEMQIKMVGVLKRIGKTPKEISELLELDYDYVMSIIEKQ